MKDVGYLDHERLFGLTTLPRRLIVVGGGPIGVEMGQALGRLDAEVTLLQCGPRLLPREEPEASSLIERVLRAEGVDVRCGADLSAVRLEGEDKVVTLTVDGEPAEVRGDGIFVAVGRRPTVDGLGLEAAGVATTDRGITVDDTLATSRGHIFAVGDVNGGPQFTHWAEHEARGPRATRSSPAATSAQALPSRGRRSATPRSLALGPRSSRRAGDTVTVCTAIRSTGKGRSRRLRRVGGRLGVGHHRRQGAGGRGPPGGTARGRGDRRVGARHRPWAEAQGRGQGHPRVPDARPREPGGWPTSSSSPTGSVSGRRSSSVGSRAEAADETATPLTRGACLRTRRSEARARPAGEPPHQLWRLARPTSRSGLWAALRTDHVPAARAQPMQRWWTDLSKGAAMQDAVTQPRAWVVYESMFGSTAEIALVIADRLREGFAVHAYEVGEAPNVVPAEVELLIVGGPTHAFSMSTVESRKSAAEHHDAELVSHRLGVREWLNGVELRGAPRVAAFDTKVEPAWFWGSAARGVYRRLEALGGRPIALPESFFVSFDKGVGLLDGELDRAGVWAASLVQGRPVGVELRAPRLLRGAGYAVLAAANIALLVIVNNVLARGWFDFLTEEVGEVLVWVNLSLAAGAAANIVYIAHDTRRFVAGAEVVQAITSIIAAAVLLSVFPFDLAAYADVWPTIVKGVLIVGLVGSAVSVVVNGVKWVAALLAGEGHDGRGGHLSPR